MEYDGQAAAGPALPRGDLPADASPRDRDEEGFEHGRSRRDARREDRRVQSLLKDRHSDRSRIAELEQRLALQERERAKGRLTDLDADMAATERAARDAFADGDADAAAKANRRLAELAAERKAAEMQDAEAERASTASQNRGPAPEAAEWLERNAAWFNKDKKATALALAAHNEALQVEELTPNTPEYFAFIEEKVEGRFPGLVVRDEDEDEELEDAPPPSRRPLSARGAAPVAPNRTPPTGRPAGGSRHVKATAAEVEAAKVAGCSVQEYKAAQLERSRSGRLEISRR